MTLDTGIADASVNPGTARATDILALLETIMGQDLTGCKLLNIRCKGNLGAFTAGAQSYTSAFQVGSDLLDVADLAPAASPNQNWWGRDVLLHRGTSHQLTAANESDQIRILRNVRGPRVIRMPNQTVWFAEESVGQSVSAFWNFRVRLELP